MSETESINRKALFKQQCRSDIMAAAVALFNEYDIHQITMDQIAQKARFSKGNLYNYFATKDRLIEAILIEKTKTLVACVASCNDKEGSFKERLSQTINALLENMQREPFTSRLLIGRDIEQYDTEGQVAENGKKLMILMSELMALGIESGHLKALDPTIYVAMLTGSLKSLATFYYGECRALANAEAPTWHLVDQENTVFDLFLNGASK